MDESNDSSLCCDPFHRHRTPAKTFLRVIRESDIDKYPDINLVSGQFWCDNCRKAAANKNEGNKQDQQVPATAQASTSARQHRFSSAQPSTSAETGEECHSSSKPSDQSASEEPSHFCCDPFKLHRAKQISKNIRKITERDASRVTGLIIGAFWCDYCRKQDLLSVAASLVPFSTSNLQPTEISSQAAENENIPVKRCCNPLKIHRGEKSIVTKNLRVITEEDSTKTEGLEIGKWWCSYCQSKTYSMLSQQVPDSHPFQPVSAAATSGNLIESVEGIPEEATVEHTVSESTTTTSENLLQSDLVSSIDFGSIVVPTPTSNEANVTVSSDEDLCCNPFSLHPEEKRSKSVRKISVADGNMFSALTVYVGKFWCAPCRKSREHVKCSYSSEKRNICTGKLMRVDSLTKDQERALAWNTGIWTDASSKTVCEKHFHTFVGVHTVVDPPVITDRCCNPLKNHRKGSESVTNLNDIRICGVLRAREKNIFLKYGEKYCSKCRLEIMELPNNNQQSQETSTPVMSQGSSVGLTEVASPAIRQIQMIELKKALQSIGVVSASSVGDLKHSKQGRINAAKRHIEDAAEVAKNKVCLSLALAKEDVVTDNEQSAQHFLDLMVEVKLRLPNASKSQKYQLLSLWPPSMPRREGAEFFNVSRTLLNAAMDLREEKGLLATPSFQRSALVSEETRSAAVNFYLDDRNSKVLPGRRDVVSLGGGVYEQKRLLLSNLNELYALFKAEYSAGKIGLSVFCSLRPKWCVTAGAKGVHSVCVCQTHQDTKLMLHSLHIKDHYRELIKLCVCDDKNRECMLRICKNCPKPSEISEILEDLMMKSYFSPEDLQLMEDGSMEKRRLLAEDVQYQQWKSTDRAEMISVVCTRADLISSTTDQILKLIPHDFVARSQSEYLKQLKDNLNDSTIIVTMDFGMNYSCLIQGEIQSYHWSKKQVTIHPVVIFYKDGQEVKHRTIVFISDDLDHDADLVQVFEEKIIEIVKQDHPSTTDIEFFTDGCGAQYKNKKTFMRDCQCFKKHGIRVKRNFHATSHGKCLCDAASASVKRKVANASLQRPINEQIINALDVYQFCKSSDLDMHFVMVYKADVDKVREAAKLQKELQAVPGTRSFHQYVPLNDNTVECRFTSFDEEPAIIHCMEEVASNMDIDVGKFVLVKFSRKKFIGFVTDFCEEDGEVELTLLHPKLPATSFTWPDDLSTIIVPLPHVLDSVSLIECDNNQYELSAASKQMLTARHVLK
ncbi:uncharacterized protein LOC117652350 [Thrips palmi]|uniref:Uncharacterized protein LOC117652350 n=1 Tax=Thrips palmi TaxID=161013 RepID=A0A6P9A6B8_THRPL|nr:uncharacterized protein LOC117652350 [Thrips palmi]